MGILDLNNLPFFFLFKNLNSLDIFFFTGDKEKKNLFSFELSFN